MDERKTNKNNIRSKDEQVKSFMVGIGQNSLTTQEKPNSSERRKRDGARERERERDDEGGRKGWAKGTSTGSLSTLEHPLSSRAPSLVDYSYNSMASNSDCARMAWTH